MKPGRIGFRCPVRLGRAGPLTRNCLRTAVSALAAIGFGFAVLHPMAMAAMSNYESVVPNGKLGPFGHGTFVRKLRSGKLEGPVSQEAATHVHAGIDIVAPCGSPIYPVADGIVVDLVATEGDRDFKSSLGYMVVVQHASWLSGKPTYSIYLHMRDAPSVKKGQNVEAGKTVLGVVGATGQAQGVCHTHFEIRHFAERFLESREWNYPYNVYGKVAPPALNLLQDYWEDPVTSGSKEWVKPTVALSYLYISADKTVNLAPVVISETGKFGPAGWDARRAVEERRSLARFRDFELLRHGISKGRFEVTGFKDLSTLQNNYWGPVFGLAGNMTWFQTPPTFFDGPIELGRAEREYVALSPPVPQPFWPKALRLTPNQTSSLMQLLDETLSRASELLTKDMRQKGIDFRGSQQRAASAPRVRSFQVIDLDQDGRPEVYATVMWAGQPCDDMHATVLATWKDNWNVIRRSTYLANCPQVLTAGDPHFSVSAIDIDGDGIAELIVTESVWERVESALYRFRGGRLIKVTAVPSYAGS